jgi:FKBP-type peptidyl-prolyl cis-trans isomerase FkpA/FKBP-type peptidyl-prolyl cis-trans isomerase FklB
MELRMRYVTTFALICSIVSTIGCGADAKQRQLTEEQKTPYALGVMVGQSLESFALTPAEVELVKAGIEDGVKNKPLIPDANEYREKVQTWQRSRIQTLMAKEKEAGTAFTTKAAAAQGATKTASGIVVTTLTPGTGASPTATDRVKVHYEGKLTDGRVFDSSLARNEPATFPLDGVIPCWTEALQLMKVGGKNRIVCPQELAYGERGSPPMIRPGATLVFEVELLEIVK